MHLAVLAILRGRVPGTVPLLPLLSIVPVIFVLLCVSAVQLAVLATYVEDEFLALYHYYRSLALALPFPTASDNLKLAFNLVRLYWNSI